ncbi:MAG: succinate dehydrogenase, cytochrome b556 subunit [Thermoleophilia bacterium]|nr:succinate dehydrogenase, cytochrome b556 subunit [Thermoleophilia bacterium]
MDRATVSTSNGGSAVDVKEREAANVGAGLWKGLGMWAWLLFRVSGLILAGYLFVHIVVISQGRAGADALDDLMEFFHNPIMVFFELMLVAAVLYHALNGVRILLMDLGVGIGRHKAIFWVVMVVAAATLAVFTWSAWPSIF